MPDSYETLEEQVYQRLLTSIHVGDLAPGTRLASTRLATQFQVSRITVANALKRLASEGYLESRPHRGAVVATLDENDLREIFLVRHALEDIALNETARTADPALIARLRDLDRATRDAIARNDAADYREHERAFHMALYPASHLRLVSTMLMDLWNRLEPYRSRRHAELDLELDSAGDRTRIVDALERGDGPVAALEMRRHVDRGYERILETLRHRSTSQTSRSLPRRTPEPMAAPPGSLVDAFATVADSRRPQGRLYRQEHLLALVALASVGGASSRVQVAAWIGRLRPTVRQVLGMSPDATPSMATVHRAMRTADIAGPFRMWLDSHGYDARDATTLPDLAAEVRRQCAPASWDSFARCALNGDDTRSIEATHLAADLNRG